MIQQTMYIIYFYCEFRKIVKGKRDSFSESVGCLWEDPQYFLISVLPADDFYVNIRHKSDRTSRFAVRPDSDEVFLFGRPAGRKAGRIK